jgi:hypothetical protein
MTLSISEFEKHALMICGLPFIGLLVDYFAHQFESSHIIYNLGYFIYTSLWFGAIMWSAINLYFLYTQSSRNFGAKMLWILLNLAPVLFILAMLLSIELR